MHFFSATDKGNLAGKEI